MMKFLKKVIRLALTAGTVCIVSAAVIDFIKKYVVIEHTGADAHNTVPKDNAASCTESNEPDASVSEEDAIPADDDDAISSEEAVTATNRSYFSIDVSGDTNGVHISIDMDRFKNDAAKLKDEALTLTRNLMQGIKTADAPDCEDDGNAQGAAEEAAACEPVCEESDATPSNESEIIIETQDVPEENLNSSIHL